MNASPTRCPANCVCNYSGHCFACLAAGLRCARPGCRTTCSDGVRCGAPAPVRRAPAMPAPELVDEPACVACVRGRDVDCILLDGHTGECCPRHDPRGAFPMGPGARAVAVALARPFDADHTHGAWRMPLDECRARAAKVRASSESRPGRALSLDDLDAHERARFSRVQPRVLGARVVSASRARGVA